MWNCPDGSDISAGQGDAGTNHKLHFRSTLLLRLPPGCYIPRVWHRTVVCLRRQRPDLADEPPSPGDQVWTPLGFPLTPRTLLVIPAGSMADRIRQHGG